MAGGPPPDSEYVLFTGFGPFAGRPANPTEELLRRLAAAEAAERTAFSHVRAGPVFEVSLAGVARELPGLYAAACSGPKPAAVVHLGVHGGATEFRLEVREAARVSRWALTDRRANAACVHTVPRAPRSARPTTSWTSGAGRTGTAAWRRGSRWTPRRGRSGPRGRPR